MVGWFSKLGGRSAQRATAPSDPRFPKAWCCFALFYAAAYADGVVQQEEEDEIDALLSRTRSFQAVSDLMVEEYVRQCRDVIGQANSVFALVDHACAMLPSEPGLAHAVYAHCVDIVSADRKVIEEEREFLDHLGGALGLSRAIQLEVQHVMRWKNAY